MRLQPGTLGMTFLLASMTSLGPLSTDIYVASLPHIGAALGASTAATQMTITCFLVGFAVGQILYGPLSDTYGRRPALIGGYALYIGASLTCLFAGSIETLIVGRVFQALGGAGPIILARAIVRDLYSGQRAARQFGLMAMIAGLMPVLAPLAGGFLQDWQGWRAGFAVMAGLGLVFGSLTLLLMPETNKRVGETPFSATGVIESYGVILQNRAYRAYLGVQACSYNGIFGFVAASSYILQRVYGLSASRFGFAFAMCSCSYVAGSFVGSRMVAKRGLDGMIGLGVACQFAAGVAQVAALAFAPQNQFSVICPYMLFFVGVGLLLPQSQAAALTPFPERAGAASSMIGFVQMTSGALVGTLLGAALDKTAWPLAVLTFLAGTLGFAVFHLSASARASAPPLTRSFPPR